MCTGPLSWGSRPGGAWSPCGATGTARGDLARRRHPGRWFDLPGALRYNPRQDSIPAVPLTAAMEDSGEKVSVMENRPTLLVVGQDSIPAVPLVAAMEDSGEKVSVIENRPTLSASRRAGFHSCRWES